jgi:dephospho-CoA kinase
VDVIGLTGGIAAGKSAVAAQLATHGAHVIDADLLAREAVAPGSVGLASIHQRFGSDVIGPNGALNRAALGALVFSDPASLADLNAIVHPEVRRLYDERLALIAQSDTAAIVVYDVPLLAEARDAGEFSLVVVVHAPVEQRIDRLVTLRGMSLESARERIAAQASDEQRLALADVVIDTSGSLEQTGAQVTALWQRLRAKAETGPHHTSDSGPLS